MQKENEIFVVYDGECPFCRNYCRLARVKSGVGKLILVNAREDSPQVRQIRTQNVDLDKGMVVLYGDKIYHGADAINLLALISSRSDMFNKVTAYLFRSNTVSQLIYPLLKAYRDCTLWIVGVSQINNSIRD